MMIEHPFMPRGDGSLDAKLRAEEADVVMRMAADILDELDEVDEPGLRRLFPPGYDRDPEADKEFQSLTKDDLIEHKKLAANMVIKSIEHGKRKRGAWSARLDEETAQSWLTVVNDARLIIGTRLNVTEEDYGQLPSSDPQQNLYVYMTALQGELIEALMVGLPPGIED